MSGHRRNDVSRHIARIHGHVRGIVEILDERRSYSEIVHQMVTVRSSLEGVIQVIVDDLVEDCSSRAREKKPTGESLQELQRLVAVIQ